MKKVAIIGVGLIGGSLGMALKSNKKKTIYKVTGIGRDIDKLRLAKKLQAVDKYTLHWKEGLGDADIVVVCTPVDLIAQTIERIIPFLKPGTIITDAGSVKDRVIKEVAKAMQRNKIALKNNIVFVGAHPMAGSDKSGVQHAQQDLYRHATVVVTPQAEASKTALQEVQQMWETCGAKVLFMRPEIHDRIVALTSHLAHIVAFAFSLEVYALNKKNKDVSKLLAGSFRDITRVADSNPHDWAAISRYNKKELDKAAKNFIELVRNIKKGLNSQSKTEKVFAEAKAARQKLLHI